MAISQSMSDMSSMDDNIDPSSTQDMMVPSNSMPQQTSGMSSMSMSVGGETSSSDSDIDPSTTITTTSSYISRFKNLYLYNSSVMKLSFINSI